MKILKDLAECYNYDQGIQWVTHTRKFDSCARSLTLMQENKK